MTTAQSTPTIKISLMGRIMAPIRAVLDNPVLAVPALIVYMIAVTLILLGLNRSDPLFPLKSSLAFPPLVLSPFIVLSAKIDWRFKGLLVLAALFIFLPLIGMYDSSYFELVIQICIFSGLALGLNIVVGFAGLLDLGYVAFFAVGAYLWAMFTSPVDTYFKVNNMLVSANYFYLFIFLGVAVAATGGILLGLPVLRLRGDYLAIVTLGFGEVIRVLANNLDKPLNLTNGPQGITPIQRPTLPGFVLDGFNTLFGGIVGHPVDQASLYNVMFYILALIIIITIVFVTKNLEDAKIGRAWAAIREDETAAVAMGIPIVKMKLMAFAIGASFAGAMGALVAASRTFVSPESFSFMQSIGVLSMVILGGLGSIPGVILGAATVTILNLQILQGFSLYLSQLRQSDAVIPIINFAWRDLSAQLDPAKYQRLLFGTILVLMMIFRPDGLIPAERRKRKMISEKSEVEE